MTYNVFECNVGVKLTDLSVVHPIYYRYDNLTRKGRNYKIYYYCRFNTCSICTPTSDFSITSQCAVVRFSIRLAFILDL